MVSENPNVSLFMSSPFPEINLRNQGSYCVSDKQVIFLLHLDHHQHPLDHTCFCVRDSESNFFINSTIPNDHP